jgi:uncharacterized membrane protein (UPF0127 family)
MCISKALYLAINNNYSICTVRYKKHIFRALVADTFLKQMVGLMYRPKIGRSEAMLFKFGRSGIYPIWMLNMRFPIDIIWLDENFVVTDVVHSARPCKSMFNCRSYSNSKKATYVLEAKAGTARRLGIREGSAFSADAKCF